MSEEIKKYLDSANFKFKDVDDKGNEIELTLSEMIENLVENNKILGTYINNLQERIDKAIENCKNSIESIDKKLQDDKTIKVVDGKVVNMNEYQIVRLKAIRMKCKELLEILGEKENER